MAGRLGQEGRISRLDSFGRVERASVGRGCPGCRGDCASPLVQGWGGLLPSKARGLGPALRALPHSIKGLDHVVPSPLVGIATSWHATELESPGRKSCGFIATPVPIVRPVLGH